MLLLPRTAAAQALPVLQRLLDSVRAARPLAAVPSFGYTVSAGLAAAQPGDSVATWMARADAALYAAKREGRDRLHVAPPAGQAQDLPGDAAGATAR